MKNDIIVPCRFTDTAIKLDGLLDDPAWQKADELPFYIATTDETPISRTIGKVLWDDNYLYVGFKAWDKDIWSYYTERDSRTYTEDVLEVFIQTDPKKEPYINFEINALGTVYDAYNIHRNAGGEDAHRWAMWNCDGLRLGVHIEGKLNDPEVEDEYWGLEVAIPFAELPSLKGQSPKPGDIWRFHLSRYDYSVHLPAGMELSSTAHLTALDFHRFEDWTQLRFEK